LTFIRDTLEHCPFENVKGSAVGWFKTEILEVTKPLPEGVASPKFDEHGTTSIFATSVALDSVAPFIFPDLKAEAIGFDTSQKVWSSLKLNFVFYTASLNLYYLLRSSKVLSSALDVEKVLTQHDVDTSFVTPLKEYVVSLKTNADDPIEEQDLKLEAADLAVLDDVLGRIQEIGSRSA
jgi:Uncharacterised protein family, YAP/Alf4/glomulin